MINEEENTVCNGSDWLNKRWNTKYVHEKNDGMKLLKNNVYELQVVADTEVGQRLHRMTYGKIAW